MASSADTHTARDANWENNTETVLVTFRGGTINFAENLRPWLAAHPEWAYEVASGPDSCNIIVIEVEQMTADAIYETLLQKEPLDQPSDLYIAGVPEEGFRSKRFVLGKDADKFDPAKRQMVQPGRKVGLTPGQLAKNGGW